MSDFIDSRSINEYEVIIPTIMENDYLLELCVDLLRLNMPNGLKKITLIGPSFIELSARKFNVDFIHEDELLEFKLRDINAYFEKNNLLKNRSGWYMQQFIKLGYALRKETLEYYVTWDGDTLLLKNIPLFENEKPIFYICEGYWPPYFKTLHKLLGIEKKIIPSFISEFMIFKKIIVKDLFNKICSRNNVILRDVFTTILDSIDKNDIISGFSEFETYGNYVEKFHTGSYAFRNLEKQRNGSAYFGFFPNKDNLDWLACAYDTASFEKWTVCHRYEKKMVHWFFQKKINPKFVFKLVYIAHGIYYKLIKIARGINRKINSVMHRITSALSQIIML